MTSLLTENEMVILHRNQGSAYSERAMLALDYAGINWFSAEAPKGVPRPVQQALVGGYSRRVPLLQVGADIYCDGEEIMSQIARMSGLSKLKTTNLSEDMQQLTYYCETKGNTSVLYSFTMFEFLSAYFRHLPFNDALTFIKDRKKLAEQNPAFKQRPTRNESLPLANAYFQRLEQLVAETGYLSGTPQPNAADFAAYTMIWYQEMMTRSKMIKGFNQLHKWLDRMKNLRQETFNQIEPEKALHIAKVATPKEIPEQMKCSSKIGQYISIVPNDQLGLAIEEMVSGTLVGENSEKYILRREHKKTGVVHIHLPKQCTGACG